MSWLRRKKLTEIRTDFRIRPEMVQTKDALHSEYGVPASLALFQSALEHKGSLAGKVVTMTMTIKE